MKLIAYNTNDSIDSSIKELITLCRKILQENQTICILVSDRETANNISAKMWTAPAFIPHGLPWEDFTEIQPIIISTNPIDRDILINFEEVLSDNNHISCTFKTFILWNCKVHSKEFDIFTQTNEGKWVKGKSN